MAKSVAKVLSVGFCISHVKDRDMAQKPLYKNKKTPQGKVAANRHGKIAKTKKGTSCENLPAAIYFAAIRQADTPYVQAH